ncbi:ABC transporter substrate-binding protein [Cyanobacterium aponinum]|uniref:Periplasmic binding protein n=1 Tax=Cyanobacterium aponinum (strain PCC 10605) TaxID=755178 RepID=K9Z4K7_CYAAP|nr:iron-siderophore ABC transporter substrate-binding protein [Cyanobacterium aponinum]AFZ54116.1 periplasmic binding protein [Cyanobacterium aponinum PCC 10605]
MRKISIKFILFFCTIFLIIACQNGNNQSANDTNNCQNISHDFGITEICQKIEKIAVLGSYNLAQILSLGYQPYGFGGYFGFEKGEKITNVKEIDPILGNLITTEPYNLGNANNPSLEVLSKIKPDLILGETRNQTQYNFLSQIAPNLLFKDRTIKGKWQQDLTTLATALNETEKAQTIINNYENQLNQTKADFTEIINNKNQVLFLAGNGLNDSLFMLSKNSDLGNIFSQLGFEIITISNDNSSVTMPISLESLPDIGKQADWIFILGYNTDVKNKSNSEILANQTATIKQDWQENSLTKSLPATLNNQVYFASYALWNGLNGAIASEYILEQLREFLLNY